MTEIKIKLMPGCEKFLPVKAHCDDAGYDLRSRVDIELEPLSGAVVPAGFAMELPPGYEAQIRPRSGWAAKHHITVTNSPGTVDSNYRGEVKVILFNLGSNIFPIHAGDRIAQMVFAKVEECAFKECSDVAAIGDNRGGGFGSSGI